MGERLNLFCRSSEIDPASRRRVTAHLPNAAFLIRRQQSFRGSRWSPCYSVILALKTPDLRTQGTLWIIPRGRSWESKHRRYSLGRTRNLDVAILWYRDRLIRKLIQNSGCISVDLLFKMHFTTPEHAMGNLAVQVLSCKSVQVTFLLHLLLEQTKADKVLL